MTMDPLKNGSALTGPNSRSSVKFLPFTLRVIRDGDGDGDGAVEGLCVP